MWHRSYHQSPAGLAAHMFAHPLGEIGGDVYGPWMSASRRTADSNITVSVVTFCNLTRHRAAVLSPLAPKSRLEGTADNENEVIGKPIDVDGHARSNRCVGVGSDIRASCGLGVGEPDQHTVWKRAGSSVLDVILAADRFGIRAVLKVSLVTLLALSSTSPCM